MAGVQEENRRRIALSLLGIGAALILIGVGLWVSHHLAMRASQPAPAEPEIFINRYSTTAQVRLIQKILFWLMVLVGILGVSLYAFKLWSRRFRQALLRKPAPPTPDGDVWAMHRLPEDALADGPSNDNLSTEKE